MLLTLALLKFLIVKQSLKLLIAKVNSFVNLVVVVNMVTFGLNSNQIQTKVMNSLIISLVVLSLVNTFLLLIKVYKMLFQMVF
ncbi:membrane protein [gut metagenome]|uniref:Membrane protein n=1 Tax=gut metagenome TaxID=749906 RepID=J9FQP6_9ZZZZ